MIWWGVMVWVVRQERERMWGTSRVEGAGIAAVAAEYDDGGYMDRTDFGC